MTLLAGTTTHDRMTRAVGQFMAKVTSAELRFVGQRLASALR